jgi:hypothetical protein
VYFNFDTDDESAATGALMVYAIYRSRDQKRFKITPDMWGIVERAVKSVAKRAPNLGEFIEKLKPKLMCSTINPRWLKPNPWADVTTEGGAQIDDAAVRFKDGSFATFGNQDKRYFLTDILRDADDKEVLNLLYRQTALIVLLVRDRLEQEKPIEVTFKEVKADE